MHTPIAQHARAHAFIPHAPRNSLRTQRPTDCQRALAALPGVMVQSPQRSVVRCPPTSVRHGVPRAGLAYWHTAVRQDPVQHVHAGGGGMAEGHAKRQPGQPPPPCPTPLACNTVASASCCPFFVLRRRLGIATGILPDAYCLLRGSTPAGHPRPHARMEGCRRLARCRCLPPPAPPDRRVECGGVWGPGGVWSQHGT